MSDLVWMKTNWGERWQYKQQQHARSHGDMFAFHVLFLFFFFFLEGPLFFSVFLDLQTLILDN